MFFSPFLRSLVFCLAAFNSAYAAEDFVVGTASGYAPFVSLNAQGQYEGFDIDLAGLVAERLGKKLVIKDLGGFSSLFLALDRGKIDAIVWGVSITEARLKQMDMVYYQGPKVDAVPLLFWDKIPEGVTGIEDLARQGAVVCVEAGSFQEQVVGRFSGLKTKQVDGITDALLEIRYGKAVATLIDPSLLARVTKQYPQIKVLTLPLLPEEQSLGNGICLNKKGGERERIAAIVDELRREGKVKALEEKWGLI